MDNDIYIKWSSSINGDFFQFLGPICYQKYGEILYVYIIYSCTHLRHFLIKQLYFWFLQYECKNQKYTDIE